MIGIKDQLKINIKVEGLNGHNYKFGHETCTDEKMRTTRIINPKYFSWFSYFVFYDWQITSHKNTRLDRSLSVLV